MGTQIYPITAVLGLTPKKGPMDLRIERMYFGRQQRPCNTESEQWFGAAYGIDTTETVASVILTT